MATEAYRLTIGGLQYGAWMENVLHFTTDNDGSVTPIDMAKKLCDSWTTFNIVEWLATCPASYGIQWIEARRVSTGKGNSWVREFPGASEVGTLGTASSTLSIAPVIRLYPTTGINTQGRVYMPSPAEGYLEDNIYQPGYTSAVAALIASMITWSDSGRDWYWAIHSPKLGIFAPVAEAALGPIIGTIGRRRTPR